MLRKIRITLASVFFIGILLLFLDFTGLTHVYLSWMASIQFLPALLAMNFIVVAALLLLTLLFGRIYCSVICPLGIFQDIFGWIGKKVKRNRYNYSPAKKWLRIIVLAVFIVLLLIGSCSLFALLAPYSAFGRMAENLFAPIVLWINNLLAVWSQKAGNYAFYPREVWIKGIGAFIVACVTFVVLGILAWRNGRTYCNTICPVGTFLGFFAKFSWFKPIIDTSICNGCRSCERNCKASCIDAKNHCIDYSRCVVCFDCIEKCKQGAISYKHTKDAFNQAFASKTASQDTAQQQESAEAASSKADMSRRSFLAVTGAFALAATAEAKEKTVRRGLAAIEDKKEPVRHTPIVPAGALGIKHLTDHCTACGLCISACPDKVLRPSDKLSSFMQPVMSYEKGFCRPGCTRCADVCPTNAIGPVTKEEKSSIQIGHAVWIRENCIPLVNGDSCGNCARHCPSGAITMVPSVEGDPGSPKIPAVNEERCIGCGECEYVCPSRPFSAIYVEGHEQHKYI